MITLKKIFFIFFSILFLCSSLFSGVVYAQTNSTIIRSSRIDIFAVSPSKVAMTATLQVQIIDGDGKIYSSINNNVGQSTLDSERNAIAVAEMIVPEAKNQYDYLFHIEAPVSSIDGPSAGAAMAFLIISMLQGREINNISVTGTISTDGYIGDVSGIYEKAEKAAEIGIELFMIPKGNRNQIIQTDSGDSKLVDLVDYANNNWNLKIVEVSTIDDVLRYGKTPIDQIDVYSTEDTIVKDFIPNPIAYSVGLEPMRDIVDSYYEIAKNKVSMVEQLLPTVTIRDITVMQTLLYLTERAKTQVSDAEIYSESNYLYTSANSSFIGLIYAQTVNEVIENPSILADNSTVFAKKLDELDKAIKITIRRSNSCDYEKIEWCIGARQRIIWAENQLNNIYEDTTSDALSKIIDYSFAVAWNDIANTFLDISIIDSEIPFIEFDYFEDAANEYIINIENQLVISSQAITQDKDLLRRINAAKTSLRKGWYVTSIYDSAVALAMIEGKRELEEDTFNVNTFIKEYNEYDIILKSQKALSSKSNIWSKMFYDHSNYFYESAKYYEGTESVQQQSNLRAARSVFLFSKNLYDAEQKILNFYNSVDVQNIDPSEISIDDLDETENKDGTPRSIYVYQKEPNGEKNVTSKDIIIYVLVGSLFFCILAIIWDLEKMKNKKTKILLHLSELEEKLMDKKISLKTYQEMKARWLSELQEYKEHKGKYKRNNIFSEKPNAVIKKKVITKKPSQPNKTKKPATKPKK